MIMISRNQQNQQNQQNSSSFLQIRISSDESITFSQTFKSEKIEFFDLKLNILLNKKNTIFLKKKNLNSKCFCLYLMNKKHCYLQEK